jgi:phage baseplate assembly protein W
VSFSIGIEDGDILLKGSQMAIVHGIDKLNQDLSIWLRERFQSDRFHLNYGSILDNYIGGVIDSSTASEVQSEVLRILQNYQALQLRALKERPGTMSADELLLNVDDVQTRIEYDSVIVNIRFTNGTGKNGNATVGVGLTGAA